MIGAAIAFALLAIAIRVCSEHLHALEIVFFRNLFSLVIMLPWMLRGARFAQLATGRMKLYLFRAVLGLSAMQSFFWALTEMPVAGVIAISFTTPLFITLGAAFILGEVVDRRRWIATLVGFAGTILIIDPGIDTILDPASVAALYFAIAMAGSVLVVKSLSRTESSQAIVTWSVMLMTPLSLPPALLVWEWPSPSAWLLLALIGTLGTIGHVCLTAAMKTADAAYVMSFDFIRLPAVAFLAWLILGETTGYSIWVGTGVIFLSTLYTARRETRLQSLADRENGQLP